MKILLLRMMGLGDVASILLPAAKIMRQRYPDAELDVMTFNVGAELMGLMPEIDKVHMVTSEQWPSEMQEALPRFIDLAEYLAYEEYDQIINLDTWFMPCVLARCLKDMGLPIAGNYLQMSMQELFSSLLTFEIQQSYVQQPWQYIESTFPNMAQWFERWWDKPEYAEMAYPQFYLNQCCQFPETIDISLDNFDKTVTFPCGERQRVIALSTSGRIASKQYPYKDELKRLLEDEGYYVWSEFNGEVSMDVTLGRLAKTDLLITVATATQWLARLVDCPSYMITGPLPPSILGAEVSAEKHIDCQYCAQSKCHLDTPFACMDIKPDLIVQQVKSFFNDKDKVQ